jgi:hypothetical protein
MVRMRLALHKTAEDSLHADIGDVALPERVVTVCRGRERRVAIAAVALARVTAAGAGIEAEGHADVEAVDARQVTLTVVRVREITL